MRIENSKLYIIQPKLLIETALVTIAAILAIGFLMANSVFRSTWFVAPGILIAAAIIPSAVKGAELPEIGFNIRQMKYSLVVLSWTCVFVFPVLFAGLWLLKFYGVDLPLRTVLPQNRQWISWLFYQFMYVAVAEEIFFRWFLQSNILRLINTMMRKQDRLQSSPGTIKGVCGLQQWISIGVSAAVFAIAHIIVSSQIVSGLTFLPGLILGWLFIRTNKSLFAPILFHGLANTCYCVMAAVLA